MAAKLEEQSADLYDRCSMAALRSKEGRAKVFSQDELLGMGIVDNAAALLGLAQDLMDGQLFRLMQMEGKICYALRTKEDAAKIITLNDDERMVYNQIENSGTNGTWTKTIKAKTNIHQTAITKAMKTLEAKQLVKPVKSVKNPAQKIYMLKHLSPNEDVSGGTWFHEGELDVELIGAVADTAIKHIQAQSWKTVWIKRERSISPGVMLDDESGNKKRKRTNGDIEGKHPKARRARVGEETQISYPAGYRGYPTVQGIHHYITESGIVKGVALTIEDLQNLLDVLVYDDRIEKIGDGYRTVRGVYGATEAMKNMQQHRAGVEAFEDAEGNGLSQAPCGRCPVFDLCEDGGPVNARNCEYFQTWLRS